MYTWVEYQQRLRNKCHQPVYIESAHFQVNSSEKIAALGSSWDIETKWRWFNVDKYYEFAEIVAEFG